MPPKVDQQARQKDEQRSVIRAGIPKDWICPTNIPMTLDIKFSDMKTEMKEYALMITEYTAVQLFKGELKYLKDAAAAVKKGFEQEFQGSWNVICGINFGSYFSYESKCCILLYRSSIGFLIWRFG